MSKIARRCGFLLLAGALALAGCTSNGGLPAELAMVDACLGPGLADLLDTLEGLDKLYTVVEDPTQAGQQGVVVTAVPGQPNTFDFDVDLAGVMNASGDDGSDQFSMSLSFAAGSKDVDVSNVVVNGQSLPGYATELAGESCVSTSAPGWVTFVLHEPGQFASVLHTHVSLDSVGPNEDGCRLHVWNLDPFAEWEGPLWGTGNSSQFPTGSPLGWHQWLIDAAGGPLLCWGFEAQFTVMGQAYTLEMGSLLSRPDPGNGGGTEPVATGSWYRGTSGSTNGEFAGEFEYYDFYFTP